MKIETAIPELEYMVFKYCSDLECDGTSNILSYYLGEIGVSFKSYIGSVYLGKKKFAPHFWIESGDYIIDFKTKMWLGDKALQGVFHKKELKKSKMSYMKDSKIDLTAGKLLLKVQQTKIRHAEEMKEFEAHLNVISTTKI